MSLHIQKKNHIVRDMLLNCL